MGIPPPRCELRGAAAQRPPQFAFQFDGDPPNSQGPIFRWVDLADRSIETPPLNSESRIDYFPDLEGVGAAIRKDQIREWRVPMPPLNSQNFEDRRVCELENGYWPCSYPVYKGGYM